MQMATYRLHLKKGKIGFAGEHAAYILREKKYASKSEDLVYSESRNMNFTEGTSAVKFWEYADTYERSDGVAYRELELNIPNEFNHEQAKELVDTFVKKEMGDSYPCSYAIHDPYYGTGGRNLHCHLIFSERENDGIYRELHKFFKRANSKKPELGGAKKNRNWQKKGRLLGLRKSWEEESNKFLEKNGFETRVDSRSIDAIRKDLLEQGKYEEAEKYNRNPINISGKILYKVDNNIELTEEEKRKYEKHLDNIEQKKNLEKKFKEKSQKIIKVEDIKKLEKDNTKDRAINIVSKGEYFKLKREYYNIKKTLKKYPNNDVLQAKSNFVMEKITKIEMSVRLSSRFIKIYGELEERKIKDLATFKEAYEKQENKKYVSEKEEKIVEKYKDYSLVKLKIRLEMLEHEEVTSKAINILTGYKHSSNLSELYKLEEKGQEIEKEYTQTSLYSPNISDLKALLKQKEKNKKGIEEKKEELLKDIDSVPKEKIDVLVEKIEKEREEEKKIIKAFINEKEKNSPRTEIRLAKEKLELLMKHSNLEKLYSKEMSEGEGNHKKVYSIANELKAVENTLNKEYQQVSVDKELFKPHEQEIRKSILENGNRIEKDQKIVNKLDSILKSKHEEYGLSGIEIIAIGKISKGEYWKVYKEKEAIKQTLKKEEKALATMSPFSFGKSLLRKNIELHKSTHTSLVKREKEIVRSGRNHPELKKEVLFLKNQYTKMIDKYKQEIIVAKRDNQANYQLLEKGKDKKKVKSLKKSPVYYSNGKGSVGKLRNFILMDESEIRSNLEITLKKEKENEWER